MYLGPVLLLLSLPGPIDSGTAPPSERGGRFYIVDSAAGSREPVFDHAAVAKQLSDLIGRALQGGQLPLSKLDFYREGEIGLHIPGTRFVLDTETGSISVDPHGGVAISEVPSPDGRWAAFTRNHDLFLRDLHSGDERRLTFDGTRDQAYAAHADSIAWSQELKLAGVSLPPPVLWAPDSSVLVTHLLDQSDIHEQHYIAASPAQAGPPELRAKRSPMPGCDKVPVAHLVTIDIESGAVTKPVMSGLTMPYLPPEWVGRVWFNEENTGLYVLNVDRFERV